MIIRSDHEIYEIEETNTKDFIIEAGTAEEAYKLAERKYRAGEFVLDPGECQFK